MANDAEGGEHLLLGESERLILFIADEYVEVRLDELRDCRAVRHGVRGRKMRVERKPTKLKSHEFQDYF